MLRNLCIITACIFLFQASYGHGGTNSQRHPRLRQRRPRQRLRSRTYNRPANTQQSNFVTTWPNNIQIVDNPIIIFPEPDQAEQANVTKRLDDVVNEIQELMWMLPYSDEYTDRFLDANGVKQRHSQPLLLLINQLKKVPHKKLQRQVRKVLCEQRRQIEKYTCGAKESDERITNLINSIDLLKINYKDPLNNDINQPHTIFTPRGPITVNQNLQITTLGINYSGSNDRMMQDVDIERTFHSGPDNNTMDQVD